MLPAVWLYATLEGIGAARAIERLCEHHAAYRWLCGGVPVNHDMLSAFRRDSGPELDRLLTQSLTGLIAEGLVTLEEVMIDGTETQARAGRGSLAQAERLTRIETRRRSTWRGRSASWRKSGRAGAAARSERCAPQRSRRFGCSGHGRGSSNSKRRSASGRRRS